MLKIKDRVINGSKLKGQIIDIKELNNISGHPKLYLIKYPLFTFKNPFKRKLWTFGFDLKKVDDNK
jgi:hypothetical protein